MKIIPESLIMKILCFFIVLSIFPQTISAETVMTLRPLVGYGVSNSDDTQFDGNVRHLGIRALLHTDGNRRFGLELNRFQFDKNDKARDFYAFGIVLEQTLANWFKMSVGTVGYVRYGPGSDSPVGIVTNLGWEPNTSKSLKPYIVLRNDIIFHDQTNTISSVSFGLNWMF